MLDALWTGVPPFADATTLADFPQPMEDVDIAVAVAMVRGMCGWHIAPVATLTFELNSDGTSVFELPSYQLGEPTSVTAGRGVDAVPIEGWTWSRNGLLEVPCSYPLGLAKVVVTAPSGLEEAPADLLAVIADIARARTTAGTRSVGLKQRTIGGVSYTYADAVPADDSRYRAALARFML